MNDNAQTRKKQHGGRASRDTGLVEITHLRNWNRSLGRLAGDAPRILPGWASPPVLDESSGTRQSPRPINQEDGPNVRMGKVVPRQFR